jgi:hypothetical protein
VLSLTSQHIERLWPPSSLLWDPPPHTQKWWGKPVTLPKQVPGHCSSTGAKRHTLRAIISLISQCPALQLCSAPHQEARSPAQTGSPQALIPEGHTPMLLSTRKPTATSRYTPCSTYHYSMGTRKPASHWTQRPSVLHHAHSLLTEWEPQLLHPE